MQTWFHHSHFWLLLTVFRLAYAEPAQKLFPLTSVADPDPGSGAFLTPGSGIRNRFIPDPGSRIPDPGSRIPDPKLKPKPIPDPQHASYTEAGRKSFRRMSQCAPKFLCVGSVKGEKNHFLFLKR
jgi:hypothetical protein